MSYGDTLKQLRLEKGWTQEQVTEKLKAGKNTYPAWERGEREPIEPMKYLIADIFEVPVGYIFDTEEE